MSLASSRVFSSSLPSYRTCTFLKNKKFAGRRWEKLGGLRLGLSHQILIIDIGRCALKNILYFLPIEAPTRSGILHIDHSLAVSKLFLEFLKVPSKIASAGQTGKRIRLQIELIVEDWTNRGKIDTSALKCSAYLTLVLLEKMISLAGKFFYKPTLYLQSYIDMGQTGYSLKQQWRYLSLFGSGLSIFKATVKVATRREVKKNMIKIVLEIGEVTLVIFVIYGYRIPPTVSICLITAKTIFSIWKKTLYTKP